MSGLGPGSASSSELNAATGSNSFNQAPTGPEEKRFPAASAHGSRLGVANLRSSASPWGSREVRVDARLQGVEIPIADDGMADISKIQRDLGWKPTVPFDQGVRRMMADIELWRDAPLWDPQSIAAATKTWFQYLG